MNALRQHWTMRGALRQLAHPWTQALLLVCAGLVLAFSPDLYLFMLARAFLWPWALVFGAIALLSAGLRRWLPALAALVALMLAGIAQAKGHAPPDGAKGQACLRIAQMNLYQYNDRHGEVIGTARGTGADLISFQEVDSAWGRALTHGLEDLYPYGLVRPQYDLYGIAVFSKLPLLGVEVLQLGVRPVITAKVRTAEGAVRIFAVHATSPGSYGEFQDRQAQLDLLAGLVAASAMPTVVVGDLNTVSWDDAFRQLCSKAGLHEGGGAPLATWPATAGLPMVPLDHVLVTPPLGVASTRSFPVPGSDHRGLVAEITSTQP